jgi:hypothetical protein
VQVLEQRDDDNGKVFRLLLFFSEAGVVPLSPLWTSDRGAMEKAAHALATATGTRAVNAGEDVI